MSNESANNIHSQMSTAWTRVAGRIVESPCIVLKFQCATNIIGEVFIEEIQVCPPRKWKPGAVYVGNGSQRLVDLKPGSTKLADSHAVDWEISQQVTRDAWTLVLCNSKPEQALPENWEFDVAILLDKPVDSSGGELVINIDDVKHSLDFTVTENNCSAPWIVRLESDPSKTNALERGQEVVLRWEVQNIDGDAELRGSISGANTMRISNGTKGQCSVRALGESIYTLTAVVNQDGKRVEVVRTIEINLAAPQFGLNFDFFPTQVFPDGPVVAYRSAYDVGKVQFMCSGGGPALPTMNDDGKRSTIEDTIVLGSGPKEGQTWTFGAVYASTDGEKTSPNRSIMGVAPLEVENSMFLHLPLSFGTAQSPQVMALVAGAFFVTSRDPIPRVAKRDWIAIATTIGLELWVRDPSNRAVKTAADIQGAQWSNNWLDDALAGAFWGVGKANNSNEPESQSVIAIRTPQNQESIAEVIEFELPLRENNPHRSVLTLSDPRFARGNVKLLAVGKRVFVIGDGVAISYERGLHLTTFRDEARLTMVAYSEWSIVALARESSVSDDGHLFALDKKSGMLLRFDIRGGVVQPPQMAASGNGQVARLDKLQQMQASSALVGQRFPCELCEEGRGYTGTNPDGTISEYLNPIDERSSMVAIGGVLLVRSEVVDPSVGRRIQDRAYDPRLDVWARCGHPFALTNTSTPNFLASTNDTLYCLADDQLLYVEGSLASFVGFLAADYSPLDAKYLADPPWPPTFVFPVVDNRTALPLKWLDGRASPALFKDGRLRLALECELSPIITIEAELDPNTGTLLRASCKAFATDRDVNLRRIDGNVLILEPLRFTLRLVATGSLVLPFSYQISTAGLNTVVGDSYTGQTIEIHSLTGESHCQVEFKYTPAYNALDVRAKIVIVQGKIADLQMLGQHAHLFEVEIDEGPTVRLALRD